MDIYKSKIQKLILPKYQSVFITDYFERISSTINGRPEILNKDLLAKPRVRTRTEIIWASDSFSSEPKPLADLSHAERSRYADILRRDLNQLLDSIESLYEEEGGREMAELLSKALEYVDDKNVFCGDGKVVIVNWGVVPREGNRLDPGVIVRAGKLQGQWAFMPAPKPSEAKEPSVEVGPRTNDLPEVAEKPDQIAQPEDRGSSEAVTKSESVTETAGFSTKAATGQAQSVSETTGTDGENSSDANVTAGTDKAAGTAEVISVRSDNQDKSEVKKEEEPQKPAVKPVAEGKKADRKSPSSEVSFGRALGVIGRKIWPWLAGLAAVVLILFLCRDYQGRPNQINPFYNALPKNPVILPVYEGKVTKSQDGSYTVCSDRLNILFESVGDKTFQTWAEEFKSKYPASGYKVVYYNPTLKTMQIVVPPEERIAVLNGIKDKLDLKGFDVFEERVYTVDLTPSDPAMNDADKNWYIAAIHAEDAWDVTMGSEDVVVAVVDNGFDLNHPELSGKVVMPYNAVENNRNIRPIITKFGPHKHGTHVAATAVGHADNGAGLLGIAPKCKLMPVQVGFDNPEGHMSSAAVLHGTLYAIENGADVINLSLGSSPGEPFVSLPENMQLTYIANNGLLEEAVWRGVLEKANQKGCIIVMSAGNEHSLSGLDPKKRGDGAILVSAIGPYLQQASFSNYGRYPNLGLDYSNVSAPGINIYSAAPSGKYAFSNGTSMAAPIVTGAVALLKSVDRNITVQEAREILQTTGHEVSPKIGPVIDLGSAVRKAKGFPGDLQNPGDPGEQKDCDAIAAEIERLERRLEELKKSCPAGAEKDTLKYEDAVKDPSNMNGLWKATTKLYSSNKKEIELYLEIDGQKGQLLIIEDGLNYTAPLSVKVGDGKITIVQNDEARCRDKETETYFIRYTYVCSEDKNGNLKCVATDKSGTKVEFNLVRTRKKKT